MIAEFITYLQGAGLTPAVKFAWTTEPVEDYSEELPVIMVYPQGYTPQPSGIDNFVVQSTDVEIVCLLGCAIADYETLLDQLRSKVIGYTQGYYDAMEMAGASIEGIKGGYIWWRETYTTRIHIRQTL